MSIYGFPYTNFHDVNLDWILKHIGDVQPVPVFWEAIVTVTEDEDNPGTYIITAVFTDCGKYLDAWERGSRITCRIPATQYNPKMDDCIISVYWASPRSIVTPNMGMLTQDPDTDTITYTFSVTP